jgi:CBS domain-containing protein
MRADQIMSLPVVTCRSNETVARAAREMLDHDCGAIPIVNDKGKLVGMLTDRDICMSALAQGVSLASISIHTAMTNDVYAATPDTDVAAIREVMRINRVHRVPVVDRDNKPIGIVSATDLAVA